MHMQHNISLKPYNSFGIDMPAAQYLELRDEAELYELSGLPGEKKVIGGGSNILLTQPAEALIIRNCLRGISVLEENDEHTWLEVKAGENWHGLVMHAIGQNLGGIENLSLIPGCVGASPMQNIGAYGVEVKDTIDSVTAWDWAAGRFMTLSNAECRFGYRDSIFKQELKGKVLITSVVYRLDKQHRLNTSYGAIREQLDVMGVTTPTIKSVSDAVIAIRQSKLPDPAVIGNAGSFFKNPTIPASQYNVLKDSHPMMPSFPVDDARVKVPAGWLIEQCGWKGYRDRDAGVHPKQALVLVNYGQATGAEIWALSQRIVDSVFSTYGIELEREVNIW
jgi:UDP-N-acetylmuramate dehydrogenase